jgi:tripartite-type tricarboxylate transporter receptor subunit TctC
VPTFAESGVPDFVVNSWVGLLAPTGTPAAVISRINTELNAVLNDASVRRPDCEVSHSCQIFASAALICAPLAGFTRMLP